MNNELNIQEEINKTIQSLDNYKGKKARPFMYTRIQAKMENEESLSLFSWFFDTPILKPTLAAIIIAINVITIAQITNLNQTVTTNEQSSAIVMAEEYGLLQSTESYFELYNE